MSSITFPPEWWKWPKQQSGPSFLDTVKTKLLNELTRDPTKFWTYGDIFRQHFEKKDGSFLIKQFPWFQDQPLSAFERDTTLSVSALVHKQFSPCHGIRLSHTVFDPYRMVSFAMLTDVYKLADEQGKKLLRELFDQAVKLFDLIDNKITNAEASSVLSSLTLCSWPTYAPSAILVTVEKAIKKPWLQQSSLWWDTNDSWFFDQQVFDTLSQKTYSLSTLYRQWIWLGWQGNIDPDGSTSLSQCFASDTTGESLKAISAFLESILYYQGIDDLLVQQTVKNMIDQYSQTMMTPPLSSIGEAIKAQRLVKVRSLAENNPDWPEPMRERYIRLDKAFDVDDVYFWDYVKKHGWDDVVSQLKNDIPHANQPKKKNPAIQKTFATIQWLVDQYNQRNQNNPLALADPRLGPASRKEFEKQVVILQDFFRTTSLQWVLFDDDNPNNILSDGNIQSFLVQCDQENNDVSRNASQLPLFSQRRKKYLLDKAFSWSQGNLFDHSDNNPESKWINDLDEPYRTLVRQLATRQDDTQPFIVTDKVLKDQLCTSLWNEQKRCLDQLRNPSIPWGWPIENDFLKPEFETMLKALYGQDNQDSIILNLWHDWDDEKQQIITNSIRLPILSRDFEPWTWTSPITPADVVSDDFFPYRVELDASSLDDQTKIQLAWALGKHPDSVQWSNLVVCGKKELDSLVRVMREQMTKSRAEQAHEATTDTLGMNDDAVMGWKSWWQDAEDGSLGPERLSEVDQKVKKLATQWKDLAEKNWFDVSDKNVNFPWLTPWVNFVGKVPESWWWSSHPFSADAWMSMEVMHVSSDNPPRITVKHRGGVVWFKPVIKTFSLNEKFLSFFSWDNAFVLKDTTALPLFDAQYKNDIVDPTLASGWYFVVDGDAYPLPWLVSDQSHQKFFFRIEKSWDTYIVHTDPWYEIERDWDKTTIIEQVWYPPLTLTRAELLGFLKERESIGMRRVDEWEYKKKQAEEKTMLENSKLYNQTAGKDMPIPFTIAWFFKFLKDGRNGIIDGLKKKDETNAKLCATYLFSKLSALSGLPLIGDYLGEMASSAHKELQEEKAKIVKDYFDELNGYKVDGHPSRVVPEILVELLGEVKGPVCNLDHTTRCKLMGAMMYMYKKEGNPYARGLNVFGPWTYVRGILGEVYYQEFRREYSVMEERVRRGDDQALEAFASLERDFIVENMRGWVTYFKNFNKPNDWFIKHFPRSIISEFDQATKEVNMKKKYDDQIDSLNLAPYSSCLKEFKNNMRNGHYPQAFASVFMMYKKASTLTQKKEIQACLFLMIVSGATLWWLDDSLQSEMQKIARSIGFPIAIMSQSPQQEKIALTLLKVSQTYWKGNTALLASAWWKILENLTKLGAENSDTRKRPAKINEILTTSFAFDGSWTTQSYFSWFAHCVGDLEDFLSSKWEKSLLTVVKKKPEETGVHPVDRALCSEYYDKVVGESGSKTESLALGDMSTEGMWYDPFLLGSSVFNFLWLAPSDPKQKKRYDALCSWIAHKTEFLRTQQEDDVEKFSYLFQRMLGILWSFWIEARLMGDIVENIVCMHKQNIAPEEIKRMIAIFLWTRMNQKDPWSEKLREVMKNMIGFMCTNYTLFTNEKTWSKLAKDLDGYFERGDYITSAFTSAMSWVTKKKYVSYSYQKWQEQREYNGRMIRNTTTGQDASNNYLLYNKYSSVWLINKDIVDMLKDNKWVVREEKIDRELASLTWFVPPRFNPLAINNIMKTPVQWWADIDW